MCVSIIAFLLTCGSQAYKIEVSRSKQSPRHIWKTYSDFKELHSKVPPTADHTDPQIDG
jgi:hypothetical protein